MQQKIFEISVHTLILVKNEEKYLVNYFLDQLSYILWTNNKLLYFLYKCDGLWFLYDILTLGPFQNEILHIQRSDILHERDWRRFCPKSHQLQSITDFDLNKYFLCFFVCYSIFDNMDSLQNLQIWTPKTDILDLKYWNWKQMATRRNKIWIKWPFSKKELCRWNDAIFPYFQYFPWNFIFLSVTWVFKRSHHMPYLSGRIQSL